MIGTGRRLGVAAIATLAILTLMSTSAGASGTTPFSASCGATP